MYLMPLKHDYALIPHFNICEMLLKENLGSDFGNVAVRMSTSVMFIRVENVKHLNI